MKYEFWGRASPDFSVVVTEQKYPPNPANVTFSGTLEEATYQLFDDGKPILEPLKRIKITIEVEP